MENVTKQKRATGNIRERIMQAALKVFGERGYERSTTKLIAAEAEIAEGTIFNYFRTKKDILVSFLEEQIVGPLPEVFADSSASDEEIVKAFLRNRIDTLRENSAMFRILMSEALFDPQMAKEFYDRVFRQGLELLKHYAQERINRGSFRNLDPQVIARNLAAYAIAFGFMEQITASDPSMRVDDNTIDTLASIFLHGVTNAGQVESA